MVQSLWLRAVKISLPLPNFFFVTNNISELDGRYSIFGKIIKGLDVLKKINKEDYIKAVQIIN